jgi:hypothetical protein
MVSDPNVASRCRRCGSPVPAGGPGRRRRFCSDACRQAEHRVRARENTVRRCQISVGAVRCPRAATGKLFGAALPGTDQAVDKYEVSTCDECRPFATGWLTQAAGVQPAWAQPDAVRPARQAADGHTG